MANNRIDQLLNERARIEAELEDAFADEDEWPRMVTLYSHSTKETNRDAIEGSDEFIGMSDDAMDTFLEQFVYALYEVEFQLAVNKDGTYKILRVSEGETDILTPDV